ncbi:jim lovell [Asbolus verrucosus]|uniref:Jim lovell n=1 Tax=Asbolus verrucosus TaxID=1661398 RepID=A0A482V9G7_ASBVE|nr:jim lovell [Asbolus verrucosus]
MTQSHYSLRWNNHQTHILAAFDALLQAETLVDVTLVCAETSVRAHKVVLSACSPFFQRIFSENPCKHPVIVLKDFSGWEVQAIVDFMYKGEISVVQEQLQSLIKAAESLQVRGLANQDPFGVDKESTSIINQTPTPSTSPNDFDRSYFGRFPTPGITVRTPGERSSPFSPLSCPSSYEPSVKLPHMSRLSFPESLLPRSECQSPIPRRKQARPRRRSGELCGAQDLTKPSPPPEEAAPENLCMKKPTNKDEKSIKDEEVKIRIPDLSASPEIDLSMQGGNNKEFRSSPPVSLPPTLNMKQEIDSHSPLPFPPMPSVSALAMTPPHSKFFGLDSPLGLFPPGLDGCRNPLFDMTDPRTTPDSQLFVKKKMGRPKGQHSAPRGGPPRSWTNAELTEALQHVWNKKMTTSQASRIFGIPYNSLLMYVRGKYGKSLKLEQLRKDCIGGPTPPMDLLNMGNNNNNACKNERDNESIQPNTRPSSTEEQHPQPPVFNPFAHNFYPDFGTGFPIPVSMIHLLPQSEKSRDHYGAQPQSEDDCKNERVKKELDEDDLFRPPALSVDDRRELVQQNGQD